MPALSLRLSDELERRLGEEAHREGVPRSEVARQAIGDFLARREKERFMEQLVSAARTLVQNPAQAPRAEDLIDEAAVLDVEAIDIAEGRNAGTSWPEEDGTRWWK